MGTDELTLVQDAFATNWIAPLGPHVDAFEKEFCEYLGKTRSRKPETVLLPLPMPPVRPSRKLAATTFTDRRPVVEHQAPKTVRQSRHLQGRGQMAHNHLHANPS